MLIDSFPLGQRRRNTAVSQMLQPVGGVSLAAGSQKTIQSLSRGCTYVDLSVNNTPIVSDYPDVGFYQWTVPNTIGLPPFESSPRIQPPHRSVSRRRRSPSTSGKPASNCFAHGHHRVTANSSTVVSWKRGAGVADAVNVLYRASSAAPSSRSQATSQESSLSRRAGYAFP